MSPPFPEVRIGRYDSDGETGRNGKSKNYPYDCMGIWRRLQLPLSSLLVVTRSVWWGGRGEAGKWRCRTMRQVMYVPERGRHTNTDDSCSLT